MIFLVFVLMLIRIIFFDIKYGRIHYYKAKKRRKKILPFLYGKKSIFKKFNRKD